MMHYRKRVVSSSSIALSLLDTSLWLLYISHMSDLLVAPKGGFLNCITQSWDSINSHFLPPQELFRLVIAVACHYLWLQKPSWQFFNQLLLRIFSSCLTITQVRKYFRFLMKMFIFHGINWLPFLTSSRPNREPWQGVDEPDFKHEVPADWRKMTMCQSCLLRPSASITSKCTLREVPWKSRLWHSI